MTLIKSKVPMPVYLSKYQNLKQTPRYREEYDKILWKRSGKRVYKGFDKKEG